jgi:membrane protein YdbS with pleckstrin-like domain
VKLCQRDADITNTEAWELVTAQREWRAALGEMKRAHRPPSLLTLFNWIGISWYLTVLASYALLEWQVASLPVWSRMTIATLMLLGHLYIWELRRRSNE